MKAFLPEEYQGVMHRNSVTFFATGVLILVSIVDVIYLSISKSFASVPMVIGLVSIGMGHGAFDSQQIFGRKHHREIAPLLFRYASAMVVAALAFWIFPTAAILGFLILAFIHFGKEDSESFVNSAHMLSRATLRCLRISHGSLVIGLPLIVNPQESADFFRRVQRIIGHSPTRHFWELEMAGHILLIATIASLIITATRLWPYRTLFMRWCIDSLLLAIAAVILNPEFFIGLYLLVWHAPQHLVDIHNQGDLTACGTSRNLLLQIWKNIIGSLPFLIPAWLAVAGLVWYGDGLVLGVAESNLRLAESKFLAEISAATVAIYVVVTPPHHLLQCGWLKPGVKRGIVNFGRAISGETIVAKGPQSISLVTCRREP